MIVVADTGPLNYLVLIRAINVLQPLFTRVIVPHSVAAELNQDGAPAAVRSWISRPPRWLEVRPDPTYDPTLAFLDPGERAALTLAELLSADELLIDERVGRSEAQRRQMHVTGTLGILADGHRLGLLNFDQALTQLRSTNFRMSSDVETHVR